MSEHDGLDAATPPAGAPNGAQDRTLSATAPLGDFRLVREIGRGGMGVVYEAEQLSLRRRVALKVLPFASALDPKQLLRFQNEAHAAAQLRHPNIVSVYFVGSDRGVHFYAMEFIEGQTLAGVIRGLREQAGLGGAVEWLSTKAQRAAQAPRPADAEDAAATRIFSGTPTCPLPDTEVEPPPGRSTLRARQTAAFFRMAARLGMQVARALEHAHQLGIVHRDIKPANLLVDVQGQIWITDFGLAQVRSDTRLTLTGDLLGTLRYMSPEQALAKRAVVDHRSDIYSLGATLYELLTLEPAVEGQDREELLRRIAFDEPTAPRKISKAIPAELETIVLKAMAKNPGERYPTAQELADDLERFLKDEPIRARRPTLWQRARKWAQRHRPVVTTACVAGVVLLLLTIGLLAASNLLLTREQQRTQDEMREKGIALERERDLLYLHRIALAHRLWLANHPGRSEQLLEECPENRRRWEWHYLKRLCHSELSILRADKAGRLAGVAFSPDGRRLAAVDEKHGLFAWDLQSGQEIAVLRKPLGSLGTVAFSPDGARLVVGELRNPGGGRVWVFDTATGRELLQWHAHGDWIYSLAFSPDGSRLATASFDRTAKVWDASTGKQLLALPPNPKAWHRGIAYSADGQYLASAGPSQDLKLFDATTGEELHAFKGHTAPVVCVAFSPKGDYLASAGLDRIARVWDVKTRKPVATYHGHEGEIHTIAFSPSGKRVATAGYDQTVRVWHAASGKEFGVYRGHGEWVLGVAFDRDGERLASAAHDGTVRVWDTTRSQNARVLSAPRIPWRLAFSPDSRRLAATSQTLEQRGEVWVWDSRTGSQLHRIAAQPMMIYGLAFSPDGKLLATASKDRTIKLWNAATGEEARAWQAGSEAVHFLAFDPTGQYLASAELYDRVKLWEVSTGREVQTFEAGRKEEINGLAFTPDGRHLLWDRQGGVLTFVEPGSGRSVRSLCGNPSEVTTFALSADGKRLATAHKDRSLTVWDLVTDKALHVLRGPIATTGSLSFSPEGRRLASGSADNSIRIWDVDSGQEILMLQGHSQIVGSVAFSPDGHFLASAGRDGTVRIWDATPLSEAAAGTRSAPGDER